MLGHSARKRFSQNFLHDQFWIGRIVSAIDAKPGDAVVEIGPGLAALTAPLITAAGHITALEIDRDLAQRLRERFAPEQLTLIEGDALAFDWPAFMPGRSDLRVVGNLPYHISTPLLFVLMPIAARLRDAHFMLQKEVVDRIVATPGGKDYGRLSVMLQRRFATTRLFDVPRGAFSPVPQVTSSIVRLVPHPAASLVAVDEAAFAAVVTAAFGQRRKTLRNALSALLSVTQIEDVGVDAGERAEQLSVDAFVRLAQQAARTE